MCIRDRTIALADSIMSKVKYVLKLKEYYKKYPGKGYGGSFHKWAASVSMEPYNSFGNGSAMRVSPVGWAYNSLEEVLEKAKESAEVTHNHPEGIKGAQATAASIFLARTGNSKEAIKEYIELNFGYDLNLEIEELRSTYSFDESCQGTVPQAIYTFLISDSFEDSIRKAIYIGGDSDTLACINGSIAEAFCGGISKDITKEIYARLDDKLLGVLNNFLQKYNK